MLQAIQRSLSAAQRGTLAGLGLVAISKDKLVQLFDELAERGELTREQSKNVLNLLLLRGDLESSSIANRVSKEIDFVLSKTPFAMRRELRDLAERMDAVEKNRVDANDDSKNDEPNDG